MNIRLLTSFFLPDSVGGGETHTFHLAKALQRRGHDVGVWRARSAAPVQDDYEFEGIPVELVPADAGAVAGYGLTSEAWLSAKLQRETIDVVHVTISGRCKGMLAAIASADLPMVVTFLDFHYWCSRALQHADGTLCRGPESAALCHQCLLKSAGRVHYLGRIWRGLPRPLQRFAARLPRLDTLELAARQIARDATDFQVLAGARCIFIAPSPIMRRLAEHANVPPDRVVDLPYGVPESFVGAAREKVPSAVLRIGYFGRLVAEKGVDVLLKAVRALPPDLPVELSLYGSAPPAAHAYRDRLEELAAGDSRIRFCGSVEQRVLPELHRRLDVVVLPSLWHENATIVLLESQALGTPAIVSDVEGMAPFVEPGRTGFTFPAGNAQALSDRIAWCAAHREALQEMARQCKPGLTTDTHAARIESIYEQLVRSTKVPMKQKPSPDAAPFQR